MPNRHWNSLKFKSSSACTTRVSPVILTRQTRLVSCCKKRKQISRGNALTATFSGMPNGLNSPSRKSDRRALPRHKYRTTRGWITWLLAMAISSHASKADRARAKDGFRYSRPPTAKSRMIRRYGCGGPSNSCRVAALVELTRGQPRQLEHEVDRARAFDVRKVRPTELRPVPAPPLRLARHPAISCTTAFTSSPRSALGTPKTAASATLGCVMSRFSVSWG